MVQFCFQSLSQLTAPAAGTSSKERSVEHGDRNVEGGQKVVWQVALSSKRREVALKGWVEIGPPVEGTSVCLLVPAGGVRQVHASLHAGRDAGRLLPYF